MISRPASDLGSQKRGSLRCKRIRVSPVHAECRCRVKLELLHDVSRLGIPNHCCLVHAASEKQRPRAVPLQREHRTCRTHRAVRREVVNGQVGHCRLRQSTRPHAAYPKQGSKTSLHVMGCLASDIQESGQRERVGSRIARANGAGSHLYASSASSPASLARSRSVPDRKAQPSDPTSARCN